MVTSDKTSSKTVDKTEKSTKAFVKIPLDDLIWIGSQKPSVQQLWRECWIADSYGTRPMQLTTGLRVAAFTKAKKALSDRGLFVFEPKKSIRDGRETTCWMVQNLHGSRVESFWMDDSRESSNDPCESMHDACESIDDACESSISPETQSQSNSQKLSRSKDQDLLKISLTDHEREREREEILKEEKSSQETGFGTRQHEVSKEEPQANLDGKFSATATVPKIRCNQIADKAEWEIAPGEPYPTFVEWRAQHYRKQGGHLADTAIANAKSEFRKNPARTADLWQQFLSYSNQAISNVLAAQQAGIKSEMPSCFTETAPASKQDVMEKLQAASNPTALPAPETATTLKAIAPSVTQLPDGRALPVVSAADFEVDRSEMPESVRELLRQLAAKRTMPKQSTESAKRAEIDVAQVERQLKGQSDPIDEWF